MNNYVETFVKKYTLLPNSIEVGSVNPLEEEVDLQMSNTNTDLNTVWEKSQLHC